MQVGHPKHLSICSAPTSIFRCWLPTRTPLVGCYPQPNEEKTVTKSTWFNQMKERYRPSHTWQTIHMCRRKKERKTTNRYMYNTYGRSFSRCHNRRKSIIIIYVFLQWYNILSDFYTLILFYKTKYVAKSSKWFLGEMCRFGWWSLGFWYIWKCVYGIIYVCLFCFFYSLIFLHL